MLILWKRKFMYCGRKQSTYQELLKVVKTHNCYNGDITFPDFKFTAYIVLKSFWITKREILAKVSKKFSNK